jgi:hypothetical protein
LAPIFASPDISRDASQSDIVTMHFFFSPNITKPKNPIWVCL